MKLFNTLSREIEEIHPLNPPIVTVYSCGMTVDNHPHIGHLFTYVRTDLLIRALIGSGLKPKWVMNITDVGHLTSDADEGEDKLQKGAAREGKTSWDIARYYEAEFLGSLKELGNLSPDYIVRASEHIPEQIELIRTLESKGFTYVIDDGVYYDTSKFPRYKDFARLDLDEQQAGARVEFNTQKRNISDFALWKFSPKDKKRDMEWDSPWGLGFPGWHIECSAMSMKYLGNTIDIHTGGIEHIPIHHTNEIAQSEAATGQKFVDYWMHSNHITIEGVKISKSLGNGIRLSQIKARGYSPEVLRLHIIESHYQSQSKFSWLSLESAKQRLIDLKAMAALMHQTSENKTDSFNFNEVSDRILQALKDNLATPQVALILSDTAKKLLTRGIADTEASSLKEMLTNIDKLTGLNLSDEADLNEEQRRLFDQRMKARASGNYQESDKLRTELESLGIGLEDKSGYSLWHHLDV